MASMASILAPAKKTAVHNVYFSPTGPSSVAALRFLAKHRDRIRALGVRFAPFPVEAAHLRDRRVRAALRARGIAALPAVLAGGRALVGAEHIAGFYRGALRRTAERARRRAASEEDLVGDFYRRELVGRGPDRAGEDAVGAEAGSGDMMGAYRQAMTRRAAPSAPPDQDDLDGGGAPRDQGGAAAYAPAARAYSESNLAEDAGPIDPIDAFAEQKYRENLKAYDD